MAPALRQFHYYYTDILELVDKSTTKDLMMDFKRKQIDPKKLRDVLLYVAHYGTLAMRADIGAAVLGDQEVIKRLKEAAPPCRRSQRNPRPATDDASAARP